VALVERNVYIIVYIFTIYIHVFTFDYFEYKDLGKPVNLKISVFFAHNATVFHMLKYSKLAVCENYRFDIIMYIWV